MTPPIPAPPPSSRSVFEVRGRTYTLGHVFSAAAFGGWEGDFWKELERGLACAAYAGDEGFEIDSAVLQESADQFRYQRNLVTAEETERWLSDHDVDEDDLVGWLERRYWLERFTREERRIGDSYTPAPSVLTDVLWPEVVFSGCLGPLAIPLARRVATDAAVHDNGTAAAQTIRLQLRRRRSSNGPDADPKAWRRGSPGTGATRRGSASCSASSPGTSAPAPTPSRPSDAPRRWSPGGST